MTRILSSPRCTCALEAIRAVIEKRLKSRIRFVRYDLKVSETQPVLKTCTYTFTGFVEKYRGTEAQIKFKARGENCFLGEGRWIPCICDIQEHGDVWEDYEFRTRNEQHQSPPDEQETEWVVLRTTAATGNF
jgi:hypothetical protein